jgi:phospholipid transport system substrate-binding protein
MGENRGQTTFFLSLILAASALVSITSARAQELAPDAIVRKIAADAIAAAKSDPELAAGDRKKALVFAERNMLPYFDFMEATRIAVGRAWWRATKEQQDKLVTEFRAVLLRTSNAIQRYDGQTLVTLPLYMKPDATDVTVRNQYVAAGRNPVQLDFAMHKTSQGWKIYDIIVEGISLVLTYRSEFDPLLKQQGIDGLLKRLSEKNRLAGAT